MVYKEREIQI